MVWNPFRRGLKQSGGDDIQSRLERGDPAGRVLALLDSEYPDTPPPRGERVLRLPPVAAAVDAIADSLAAAPLRMVRDDGSPAPLGPAARLLENPGGGWTTGSLIRAMARDALVWGNSVWRIEESGGALRGLTRLRAEGIQVTPTEAGLIYRYTTPGGGVVFYAPDQVVHVPGDGGRDPRIGRSLYDRFPVSLRQLNHLHEFTLKLFENGANPSGILTTEKNVQPGVAADMADRFRAATRDRRVPFLGDGVAFLRVGMPPDEVQLIDLQVFAITEVARMFGINPILLQDMSRSTYNNMEEAYRDFSRRTVQPWADRIESALRVLLVPGRRVRLDLAYLTARDIGATTADALSMRAARAITLNELREAAGYPAVDDPAADALPDAAPVDEMPDGEVE